ncbi:U4/U6 small nuclear ribonucleoprotein Prp3 [Sparganum proliferum]
MDYLLASMAGKNFFTTLDLSSNYWQLEVHPEDRAKTAFSLPSGLFEFTTPAMGLANAAAICQRLMWKLLKNVCPSKCLVYLDDVLVWGTTISELQDNLSEVLTRCQEAGLTLNPRKCKFLQTKIRFLGHIVSNVDLRMNTDNIQVVQDWPQPVNGDKLRSFLGLAGYYRAIIPSKRKEQMRNLIFDEHGKTLDAVTGEEVRIPQFVPTLKANLRAQKAQNFKEALEVTTQKKPVKVSTSSSYFDPRLSYSALDQAIDASSIVNDAWITNLVEHPIKMKAPTELSKPPEIPLLLTKKERKKLRRKNRQDAQKERQELVRLGLLAPPEPKVKLANLMRVLGTDAVQDPSKVEAYVRKQMESRKRAHEAANAARKLTKDQARHKRIRKIREDTSIRTCVAVYRVKDLSNPSHRFKVETNANQLFMTGFVALNRDCNVVVVEGGPKQQKRFKRLMLHRIKWLENKRGAVDPSKVEAAANSGPCSLVWEGTVKQRAFEGMQVKTKGLSAALIHRPTSPVPRTLSGGTCSLPANVSLAIQQPAAASETFESAEKLSILGERHTPGHSPPVKHKRLPKLTKISADSAVLADLDSLTRELLRKTEGWPVEKLYDFYAPTFDRSISPPEDDIHVKEEKSLKTKLSTGGSRSAQCVKLKKKMDNHEVATRTPLGKELENPIESHNTMEHLEEVINSVKQDCEAMTREDFISAYLPSISRLSNESASDPDSTWKMSPTSSDVEPLDVTDAVRSFNTSSGSEHLSTIFLSDVAPNTTEGLREAAPTEISAGTSDIPAGVWVECVRCLKWRFLEGVKDPTELNEAWHCALQPKYSKNEDFDIACEEPETTGELTETQYVYGEFATGSVVLDKMTGYPEWPSMVDCDTEGRFAEFCPKTGEVKSYRVVFLDPENRTTQLIPANRIRRFDKASVIRLEKRHSKYKRKLEAAVQEATKALKLPVEERVYIYGMDLEARIESCLQGTKSRSAAQLYKNYVEPYRVRRKAMTPRGPVRLAFHDRTEHVNRNIVGLFSLALKNLISASKKSRSTGVKGLFEKCEMEEERRECERQKSLATRRKKGRRTTCFHEGRQAARTVLTKGTVEKGKEVLATSENFRGPPGTWIECTRCKKWRFEPNVRDPSEVSENWRCFLQKKLSPLQPSPEIEEAACAEPEDPRAKCHDQSYLFNEFTAGSIVLAKMQGFPWWPAMVDLDGSGKYARIDPETHIATHYNVVFLDPCKSTTRLLPASSIRKFTQMDKADILHNAGKHLRKIAAAFREAEEALKVSIVDRVGVFGYPHTKSTTVRDELSVKEVDSPRMALSQVPRDWKFRRSQQKMRRIEVNEATYCSSSLPHSCPINTLCYAQDVIQDIQKWAKRFENETVRTTAVDIDDLITAVLYETKDWSSERMHRTFLPYSHCRLSHKHRTVNTPNKVAEEAPTDSTPSRILTKLETVMGNEGQQVDEGLGSPRAFPESDVLSRPLGFCPLDCISSPQHSPRTNNPVARSTWTITRSASSTPGPICLLSVLKAQATAKTGLIQAFGQFITNLPFHIQLSAIKPQSQNE